MKNSYQSLLIIAALLIFSACSGSGSQSSRPTLGNSNAKVTIEEFSDIQCPACGMVGPEVEAFVRANPDLARLTFRHFPLPMHEFAFRAAEASECANNQGKFWEYLKLAFERQKNLTDDTLKAIADEIKLDKTSFTQCLDTEATRAVVKADLKEGTSRPVTYTPSLFVNGKLVQWTSKEAFEGYLRSLAD